MVHWMVITVKRCAAVWLSCDESDTLLQSARWQPLRMRDSPYGVFSASHCEKPSWGTIVFIPETKCWRRTAVPYAGRPQPAVMQNGRSSYEKGPKITCRSFWISAHSANLSEYAKRWWHVYNHKDKSSSSTLGWVKYEQRKLLWSLHST